MLVSWRQAAASVRDPAGAGPRRTRPRLGAPAASASAASPVAADGAGSSRPPTRGRPGRRSGRRWEPAPASAGRSTLTAASRRSRAAWSRSCDDQVVPGAGELEQADDDEQHPADDRDRAGVPAHDGERAEPAPHRRRRPAGTARRARCSRRRTASRRGRRSRCSARGPARRPASGRCTGSSRRRTARRAAARRASPRAGSRCSRHSRLATVSREKTPAKARPSTTVTAPSTCSIPR